MTFQDQHPDAQEFLLIPFGPGDLKTAILLAASFGYKPDSAEYLPDFPGNGWNEAEGWDGTVGELIQEDAAAAWTYLNEMHGAAADFGIRFDGFYISTSRLFLSMILAAPALKASL